VAAGDAAEQDTLLRRALDRFPDDPRFLLYLVRSEPYPSLEYRNRIARLLRVSADDPVLGEVVFEYGLRAPTGSERRWAIRVLEDLSWADPIRVVLRAELEGEADERAALDEFFAADGFRSYDAYLQLDAGLPPDLREELRAAAREYTGTSTTDPDRDGLWNERVTVTSGVVERWERDLNQDGITELAVYAVDGEPVQASQASAFGTTTVFYDQYPYVASAEVATIGGSERFTLRPRAVRFPTLAYGESGTAFDLETAVPSRVRQLSASELISASVRQDDIRHDGTISERRYLESGIVREIQRDEDGDGVWDRLLLTDGGVPRTGVRDLDADGYYEVAEGYRGGRLVALAVDDDHDGVPEVFERSGEISVREWDLNEDGVIDVEEFDLWTGSVIREFPFAEQDQ
jgi:hypothetical protein